MSAILNIDSFFFNVALRICFLTLISIRMYSIILGKSLAFCSEGMLLAEG